jgi:arylsulfatase A-like enzyme
MTPPNILLIVLDATRADACSCYGADRPTTPHLDALAAGGTLYEQAISPAPWTLPAFASLLTGLFPSQLGIFERRKLLPSVPTLASLLSEHGYATFGVTGNSWMSAEFGLQRGFDQVHKLWQLFQTSQDINRLVLLNKADPERSWVPSLLSEWRKGNPVKNVLNTAYNRLWSYRRDYGARRTRGPLVRWLAQQKAPWFAFVHYLEAHLEYKPPTSWARRFAQDWDRVHNLRKQDQLRLAWRHMAGAEPLSEADLAAWRDLYLAEVAYADHHVGLLLQALQEEGQLDQTLIAVTADHGESLGEHGLLNHQYCVYDTLLRVPLVIHYPPLFAAGRRVAWQVQTLDLVATILEMAGIEPPPCADQSLLPGIDRPRPFVVAEYGTPHIPHASLLRRYGLQPEQLEQFARGFTALRTEEYKLIVDSDGSTELYAWPEDPGEEKDLASHLPEVVGQLEKTLRHWQEALEIVPDDDVEEGLAMDPTTAARLRALGYIE